MRALREDARQLAIAAGVPTDARHVARTALTQDSYLILVLWRMRCGARRWRLPGVNHLLRRLQTLIFGIELGNEITLGRGVFFVHPIGIVVGGQARVGDRVRFMGSNTVGTAKDNGYPVVEDDAVLGAGARVLGPVRVGARAVIGANAVVLTDIPPDAVAVGMPARVVAAADARALERARD
ncbi:MAG TPA: serine O-acetyltransferase EpsC [Vicinamibacteria bacterium]